MEQNNKVFEILEKRINQIGDAWRVAKANLEKETNPYNKRKLKKIVNQYHTQWFCLTQTLYIIKCDLGL